MFRIHFRPPNRLDHQGGRLISRAASAGSGHEPIIVIGGHENQFPPAVPGDLHRFAHGLMLEITKFALKLHCRCTSHWSSPLETTK